MRPLIPDKLNGRLDEIVTKCFEGNRIMDRGMTILSVKFAMNKTESLLHPKLAHLYPLLADKVSEFQGSRNNLTFYGVTPADGSDYGKPLDFFEKILSYMNDLETLVSDVMDESREEDPVSYVFLEGFLRELIPVTNQCLLLVDKAEFFSDQIMLFDMAVEDFIIL